MAQAAWQQAAGDLATAVAWAAQQTAEYLLLVISLEETGRSGACEGLILGFYDLTHLRPRYVRVLMSATAMGSLSQASHATPQGWTDTIRHFSAGATSYDRSLERQLEDHLRLEALPAKVTDLLATPKPSIAHYPARELELSGQERQLIAALEQSLAQQISFPFHCKVAWYALTGQEYADLAQQTGWPLPLPGAAASPSSDEASAETKSDDLALKSVLRVKGTFLIDSSNGLVLNDLEPGDRMAVKITDRSPLAIRIGEHLGLIKNGDWEQAWGIVQSITVTEGMNLRLAVALTQQVVCEVSGLATVRVKAQIAEGRQPASNQQGAPHGFPAPLIVAIGLVVVGVLLVVLFGH